MEQEKSSKVGIEVETDPFAGGIQRNTSQERKKPSSFRIPQRMIKLTYRTWLLLVPQWIVSVALAATSVTQWLSLGDEECLTDGLHIKEDYAGHWRFWWITSAVLHSIAFLCQLSYFVITYTNKHNFVFRERIKFTFMPYMLTVGLLLVWTLGRGSYIRYSD